MTYIEFFDIVASKNVSTCLTFVPDRVIFIGDSSKLMKKHIENYQLVFRERGYNIEFMYKTIARSKLDSVVALLSEIVETYDDCVFDVTGGEEIFTLALGIVFNKYPDRNIQIHKINIRNNMIYDCDMDGETVYKEPPKLSVKENIRIYGGEIAKDDSGEDKVNKWDLNPEFVNDAKAMWLACKEDATTWNRQIGMFAFVDDFALADKDSLTVTVPFSEIENIIKQRNSKFIYNKTLVDKLRGYGLLKKCEKGDDGYFTITYKNSQVKRCLTNAGLLLELIVYMTAKRLVDKAGNPVYNDVLNGVTIDWDGELHENESGKFYDTVNEIDVMLMHDIVPIFISCKNGIFSSDELYKLETVAERFGGPFSKKVLVATAIDSIGSSWEFISQRADDMGIKIIENIQNMDDVEFESKLRNLWNN